jgi:hypothetical protein
MALAAATNSTTDPSQTVGTATTGACLHPAQAVPVNCNFYAQKQDVFLNGSPSKSDAGTYFFAVLVPGGQPTPNDGGLKNLSDTTCAPDNCGDTNSDGTTVPSGYSAVNREFTVDSSGKITPLIGPDHTYTFDAAGNGGNGSLSVWPFDDTTNNGGVYILASCKISDILSNSVIPNPAADSSDCKYDAFKVKPAGPPIQTASDLTVTKDANGSDTRTFGWDISKKADTSKVLSAGGGESGPVNYTVTVTHDGGTVSDVQVTGTIQVFNPNVDSFTNQTLPVDITGVTDQLSDGTDCTVSGGGPQTLTDAETDFTYTCNLSALPQGDLDNTVTVSWDDQVLANGAPLAGNSADFTFTGISFDETVADGSVTVSDSLHGKLGSVSYTDPSPTDFNYQLTFTDPAGTCTDHKNTATATIDGTATSIDSNEVTVTDCQGSDLTVSKTATPSFTRTYTWGISKSADTNKVYSAGGGASGPVNYDVSVTHDNGTDSDYAVTGTITITNPNDWEDITLSSLSDALDVSGACSPDTPGPYVVPKSDSLKVDYTCSSADPTDTKNTATVTWDASKYSTPTGSASGDKAVDFSTVSPSIVHGSVTVTDSLQGKLGTVSYTDPSPTDFKYQLTFKDPAGTCTDHKNTATATIDDTSTTIDSKEVTVTDCQGADLTVSKTATPSFTRSYTWHIKKAVDKTYVENNSGSATFNYTVTVNHDPGVNSGWQVSGKITVTNPNDWEDITANVTDTINNGGNCTVTGGTGATIPAGKSVDFAYTCSYASAPSPAAFTNTGKAAWDGTAASTPSSSATGTATGAFGAPTTVTDECVSVSDPADPKSPHTYCVGDPGDPSFSFMYSKTLTAASQACSSYDNTATFTTNDTGTTGSASQHVQYCNFGPRFTPGYWKNHLAPNGTTGCNGLPNGTSCGSQGPFAYADLTAKLGNFPVNSILLAAKIFTAMSCSFSGNSNNQNQQAIGCLAGKLLAAKYDVDINHSNPCIAPVVAEADQFLTNPPATTVTFGGYSATSINYVGPTGTYTGITSTGTSNNQRAVAIALQNALDSYVNGGYCP